MSQETPSPENKELEGFVGPVKWAMGKMKSEVVLAEQGDFNSETDAWTESALARINIAESWLKNIKESLQAREVTPGLRDQLLEDGYED